MLVTTKEADDLALLTIAELRAAVNVTGTTYDAKLTTLGLRVAAVITQACNVAPGSVEFPPTLRLEQLTETFRLKSRQEGLTLSRRPIVSITSITDGGSALGADDYEIDSARGMLMRLSGDAESYWVGPKISVVYEAGWENVPHNLKLAASKLTAVLWAEGSRTDPSLRRESIPGVIDQEWWVGPADDPILPAEIRDLLSDYVNYSLA